MKVTKNHRDVVESNIGLSTIALKKLLTPLSDTQANNCIKNVKKRLKTYRYIKANMPLSWIKRAIKNNDNA